MPDRSEINEQNSIRTVRGIKVSGELCFGS